MRHTPARQPRRCVFLGLILALTVGPFVGPVFAQASELDIEIAEEIDLGRVAPGGTAEGTTVASNTGTVAARVVLVASDATLVVTPNDLDLAPGESREIGLSLGVPGDESLAGDASRTGDGAVAVAEDIVRLVTVFVSGPDGAKDLEPMTILVRATREIGPEAAQAGARSDEAAANAAGVYDVDLYMDISCPSCKELSERTIPEIATAYGNPIEQRRYDVMDPAVMDRLMQQLERRGIALDELPVAFVQAPDGGRSVVLQGFDGIERGLEALVAGGAATGESTTGGGTVLSAGAIIGAGLVDGVNPCAFSTMLFLISMLALVGRSRREIFVIGAIYTATVFVGYLAAGFGLFASVRALMVFPVIVQGIRWVLVAMLLVLAALSLRDAVLARAGRTREMTLQLPEKTKRRIHSVIRSGTRRASLVGGTILLGLGVTIFEFSCTGQVYVPVIMYLARAGSGAAFGLLVLYNVAFIVPLLIVFGLAYAGVSMKRIGAIFEKRVAVVKLGLAVVFIALAVMTIVIN